MIPIRDINPTRISPTITLTLIALNVLVFLIWQPPANTPQGVEFLYEHAAVACELTTLEPISGADLKSGVCLDNDTGTELFPDKNLLLASLVSMFLHAGLIHLGSNMLFLWIFGNNVEEAFGKLPYILMYLVSGVAATAAFVFTNQGAIEPLVGASGAIAGVLGAYLVLFPRHRVMTIVFVVFVPVPAILFLGFWLVSQFFISGGGIAWQAHVGGFVTGVILTLPFRDVLLRRIRDIHAPVGRTQDDLFFTR